MFSESEHHFFQRVRACKQRISGSEPRLHLKDASVLSAGIPDIWVYVTSLLSIFNHRAPRRSCSCFKSYVIIIFSVLHTSRLNSGGRALRLYSSHFGGRLFLVCIFLVSINSLCLVFHIISAALLRGNAAIPCAAYAVTFVFLQTFVFTLFHRSVF
jgi:hypothetical protein